MPVTPEPTKKMGFRSRLATEANRVVGKGLVGAEGVDALRLTKVGCEAGEARSAEAIASAEAHQADNLEAANNAFQAIVAGWPCGSKRNALLRIVICVVYATHGGKTSFGCSLLRLAEEAGVSGAGDHGPSSGDVRKFIAQGEELGFLTVERKEFDKHAVKPLATATFSLGPEALSLIKAHNPPTSYDCLYTPITTWREMSLHPIWEIGGGGLGPTALRVWVHLHGFPDGLKAAWIATDLKLSKATTKRVLAALAADGLVEHEDSRYLALAADLDAIAPHKLMARPQARKRANATRRKNYQKRYNKRRYKLWEDPATGALLDTRYPQRTTRFDPETGEIMEPANASQPTDQKGQIAPCDAPGSTEPWAEPQAPYTGRKYRYCTDPIKGGRSAALLTSEHGAAIPLSIPLSKVA